MKRFYKMVTTRQTDDGFQILLDGKPVKTSRKTELRAPTQAIAQAMQQEWAQQTDAIRPDTMPVTQILNTKIDRVALERDSITAYVMKYLDTDLLCYRAAAPPELVERQNNLWQLWLDWFETQYKEKLQTTTGLTALKQSAQIHEAIKQEIQALDDDRFTVLQLVTAQSGSLVLALAFLHGRAGTHDVFKASFAEEHFKDGIYDAERYGADPLQEKQQKAAAQDLEACAFILENL